MAAALTGWLTAPYGVRWESTVTAEEQAKAFVPDEFDVPRQLVTPRFHLGPLGPFAAVAYAPRVAGPDSLGGRRPETA